MTAPTPPPSTESVTHATGFGLMLKDRKRHREAMTKTLREFGFGMFIRDINKRIDERLAEARRGDGED